MKLADQIKALEDKVIDELDRVQIEQSTTNAELGNVQGALDEIRHLLEIILDRLETDDDE